MNKTLTGSGAQIPYGPTLPSTATAYDGELFYLTSGPAQGLYVFGFIQDSDSATFGDQSAQQWSIVQNPGLYVSKSGDTMSGTLVVGGAVRAAKGPPTNSDSSTTGFSFVSDGDTGLFSALDAAAPAGGSKVSIYINSGEMFSVTNAGVGQLNGQTIWTAGNMGSGSGLNADLLDGLDSTYFRNASNLNAGTIALSLLPFTPVQQGGGTNQLTNKIYIGWSQPGQLYLQVDSTNFSNTWPLNVSGSSATANYANSAGSATSATEATSALYIHSGQTTSGLAMGFTNATFSSQPTYLWGTSDSTHNQLFAISNLSVAFATNATNATNSTNASLATKASTLSQGGSDGAAMTFNWAGNVGGNQPTWVWGSNDGNGYSNNVYNPANFSVASAAAAPWAGLTGTAPNVSTFANDVAYIKNGQSSVALSSPALSGTPTAPTAAVGTSNTQIASTAFVAAAVTASVGAQSLNATGYKVSPGGMVEIWTQVSLSAAQNGQTSVTYPTGHGASTLWCPRLSLYDPELNTSIGGQNFYGVSVQSYNTTGCVIMYGANGSAGRDIIILVDVRGHI